MYTHINKECFKQNVFLFCLIIYKGNKDDEDTDDDDELDGLGEPEGVMKRNRNIMSYMEPVTNATKQDQHVDISTCAAGRDHNPEGTRIQRI